MAGYLDNYGAGEERRSRIIKGLILGLITVLVVGGTLLFIFYNYREEKQVKNFLDLLQKHDYQSAYKFWGNDSRDYPFQKFMEDWGPQSQHADVAGAKISRSRSCGSGVILTVDFPKGPQEKLWVQKGNMVIGFSPFPGCPANR